MLLYTYITFAASWNNIYLEMRDQMIYIPTLLDDANQIDNSVKEILRISFSIQ